MLKIRHIEIRNHSYAVSRFRPYGNEVLLLLHLASTGVRVMQKPNIALSHPCDRNVPTSWRQKKGATIVAPKPPKEDGGGVQTG
jgi:hypothetical protein